MKLSRYTLFINDFPDQGKYLTFNTRTQAQVVIDGELKTILDRLPAFPGAEQARRALSSLQKMGLVVDDSEDEKRIMEDWFRTIKTDTSKMRATVLTTYDCNFACPYCVEEGVKSSIYMDEQTAQNTVSYIQERVKQDAPQELSINFYGGEPLLNGKAVKTVAAALHAFCREMGLAFFFGITTNGALLSSRLVDELKPYGLKGVMITLDGTGEFHDRKRPFRNGRGSFDTIMANILAVADKIAVSIGGNFDRENIGSFYGLLDYLEERGLASKLHQVSFKPILATLHDRRQAANTADMGCAFFEPGVMESMVSLRRAVLSKGFKADPGLGVNLCSMVMNGSSFIIDPKGALFRCPAFVGVEDFRVGDIDHPGKEDFSSLDLWKRCIDCVYVPLCGDGCLHASYVRYGDLSRLNCRKDFMEYMVQENLKLNYEFSRKERK